MDLFKFKWLRMPFIFFDKDGAAGGGASDDKADDKTDDSAGGKKDAEKAGDQQTDEKKFTQKDIDQIVKDRLERERKKQEDAAAKAQADAEKKALEEQGKHKELADKATKEAEQSKAARETAEASLKAERIRFAVILKANDLKFADAEDAFKMLDFSDVEIDDQGKPKAEMITKKLEELAKAKPYLVKADGEKKSLGTPPRKSGSNQSKQDEAPRVPTPKF